MKKMRLGLVGCGVISRIYMGNLAKSRWVEVIAVADLFIEKARGVGRPVWRCQGLHGGGAVGGSGCGHGCQSDRSQGPF